MGVRPTAPLATYFFSLIAGPYHVRRAEHDGVPLGIYCRQSLAEHLDADAEELFTVTGQCLDRFHQLFSERYPFGKYDQAFVPEFNAGAMENPGIVTFRDDYVFRSAVTDTSASCGPPPSRTRWPTCGSATWSPCAGGTTCG
ncbi:M1 family aminopeptidase [Micromonospora sp. M12]